MVQAYCRTALAVSFVCLIACNDEDETQGTLDAAELSNGTADAAPAPNDQPDATIADASIASPSMDAQGLDAASRDAATPDAFGEIATQKMFNSGTNPCGMAYDHVANQVWVYPCFGAQIFGFLPDGTASAPAPRGGETADDVDVDIAPKAFTLGQTKVSEGDLLFINGEVGTTEIHAINKSSGSVGNLATVFGNSHVVGGAYHAARNSFFLVQDKVPGLQNGNRVAEVDVITGQVIDSFQTTPNFVVNFGDLDVCQSTGHLFLVSSDETTVAEYTPSGMFLNKYPLPINVKGAAGVGFDDPTGHAWISGTDGTVWQLSMPCPAYKGR